MIAAGRYAELAAAVRCFNAELIRPSQIERLIESGSLPEIIGSLTGGRITYTEGSDLNAVETFLIERVVEISRRLAAYAPHDSRALIRHFSASYDRMVGRTARCNRGSDCYKPGRQNPDHQHFGRTI